MTNSPYLEDLATILQGKVIIVDTSSMLISGTNMLSFLPECQLIIPSIVISELENKRTHPSLGFLAREWLRFFEDLRTKHGTKLNDYIQINQKQQLKIVNHKNVIQNLPTEMDSHINDNKILSVAYHVFTQENNTNKVFLLSNDTPLRLHATLELGLNAIEFYSQQPNDTIPFMGTSTIIISNEDYLKTSDIDKNSKIKLSELLDQHEYESSHSFITATLPDENVLGYFIKTPYETKRITDKNSTYGIKARTKEQSVAINYLLSPPSENPIVSIGGGAGSGKTLLATAAGLAQVENSQYQKLIVFRSLHEMGEGQEMGFLPGDVNDKMEAWAGAIKDSLDVIANERSPRGKATKDDIKKLRDMIEISPITYLRGRSLSNAFIILDEAQNFSRSELLNILSRVGENTKIVLTSDADQVDNKFLKAGRKADIWSVINSLKQEDIFSHITLLKTERSIVANLAAKIIAEGNNS